MGLFGKGSREPKLLDPDVARSLGEAFAKQFVSRGLRPEQVDPYGPGARAFYAPAFGTEEIQRQIADEVAAALARMSRRGDVHNGLPD